jgi:hypothetical protein
MAARKSRKPGTCKRSGCSRKVKERRRSYCSPGCGARARNGKTDDPRLEGIVIGAFAVGGGMKHAAAAAGMSRSSLYEAINASPRLQAARAEAIDCAVDHAEQALYLAATGWLARPPAKRSPSRPEITALIFLLKNRRPDDWRDKKEIDAGGSLAALISEAVTGGDRS